MMMLRTLLVITFFAVGPTSARSGESQFPGAAWTPVSAAAAGLSQERLEAVAAALGGRGCILKDGKLVHSWGDQAEKSDWYSSAKPVLSTLLMFAMKEGKVASPDARIADFGWELLPKDQSMTFRHLASMTSGYARPEAPGAAWAYNDFAIQLYQKTLFDRVFKEDPDACAASRFGPLQLEDGLSFRKTNRRLSASVRDFARIVLIWMNRGKWNGQQVLPEQYFLDNMKPQVPKDLPNTVRAETNDYLEIASYGGGSDHFSTAGPGVYGFNWWFNETGAQHPETRFWPDAPADTVMSLGHGGNSSAMMPSLGLAVICAQGDWGKSEAAKADSVINQRLKLIAWAGQPVAEQVAAKTVERPKEETVEQKGVTISGEKKQWHRVTLTFRGPESSESATPNPFTDYRLNVTFSKGDKTLVVPGYFAADGDAANSGGESGNCWRVHFRPTATGMWTYKASFRTGENVAISDDPAAGKATAFDGASGQFECGPTDKTGKDFRGRGVLSYVGQRYLKFDGDGKWFLKGGVDSPENFLAYYEFDQTKPTHRYLPHALDATPGDPTWRDGRGQNLTGALNYLASVGQNSVYMLTMNVKGDGKDVWPWTSMDERVRYDCSKLDQWEIIFEYMDQLGMMQHFVLQEQENDQLLDGGDLGPTRRLYFRELIARFGHHPAITWNLGEENTNTLEQQKDFCKYFHDHDPYRHMVVVHTFPRDIERVYTALLGYPELDGASLQTNKTRQWTKEWIRRSAEAGRPWVVCLDEIGPANTGVKPDKDDFNHDDVRKDHLWGHFLSGGAGVEWLFGYKFDHNDINLEDFRSRDQMWRQTTIAVDFFHKHLPFTEMASADEYTGAAGACCLAKPGHVYAIQWRGGEKEFPLWLPKAHYTVQWFYARRGGALKTGSVPSVDGAGGFVDLGTPPSDLDRDWIAVVKLDGPAPKELTTPPAAAPPPAITPAP